MDSSSVAYPNSISVERESFVADDAPIAGRVFGRFENLVLVIPIPFLIGAALCLLFGWTPALTEQLAIKYFELFVLFNATHTILTFVLLFIVPEARGLLFESWKNKSSWLLLGCALFIGLPVLHVLISYGLVSFWGVLSIVLFLEALRAQHGVRQVYGISCLYNRSALRGMDVKEISQTRRWLAFEKKCFTWLVCLIVVTGLATVLGPSVTTFGFYKIVCVLSFFPALMVIFSSLFYRGENWFRKRVFLARVLLYPLSAFSGIAAAGSGAAHGTEYLFLTLRMFKNSKSSRKLKMFIILGVTAAVYGGLQLAYHLHWRYWSILTTAKTSPPIDVEAVILIGFVIDYLHYYLDGVIFRFSDANVKRHIGPLIGM